VNIPERTTVSSKGVTGGARERDARERRAREGLACCAQCLEEVCFQVHKVYLGLTNEMVTLSRVITKSLMARDNCVDSLWDILSKKEGTENSAGEIMGGFIREVPEANKQERFVR